MASVRVLCWKLDDGTMHLFSGKMWFLATGGYGRAYLAANLSSYMHWRWWRYGGARWLAASRYGIRSIPPDRYLWRRLLDHRGGPRRGRVS